jgi:hypothetical protein
MSTPVHMSRSGSRRGQEYFRCYSKRDGPQPIGQELTNWAPEALLRLKPQTAAAEEFAKRIGAPACASLVRRFRAA